MHYLKTLKLLLELQQLLTLLLGNLWLVADILLIPQQVDDAFSDVPKDIIVTSEAISEIFTDLFGYGLGDTASDFHRPIQILVYLFRIP